LTAYLGQYIMDHEMRSDDPVELFEHYLRAKGKKVTRSRKRIVEEVFRTPEHFDASDLWAKLRSENISVSTIYRTLELLVDSGLVRKVDLGDPHLHYEQAFGRHHHEHLICVGCGKVLEFLDQTLEDALLEVVDRLEFQHHSHSLQVFGLCKGCQAKSVRKQGKKQERAQRAW